MINSKNRLYARYINLVLLNIFPKQVLLLLLLLIKSTRQMFSICLMIMPYDKIDQITYLFYFNIVDVTLRYKASISIGTYSVKNR